MWSDGRPVDPNQTIDQAVNGGYEEEQFSREIEAEDATRMLMDDMRAQYGYASWLAWTFRDLIWSQMLMTMTISEGAFLAIPESIMG